MPVTVNGISCTLAGGVRQLSSTTGTGTLQLGAVVEADGIIYRSAIAAIGSGTTSVFTMRLGAQFETFIGTVTAGAPDTLTRSSILESSNSNNAVNWGAGDKDVFLDAAAAVFHSMQSSINTVSTSVSGLSDLRATQATTSGTSKDFTSITSGAIRITISLNGVDTNGSSGLLIQLGDSGGVETSGYAGSGGQYTATAQATDTATTGFRIGTGMGSGAVNGAVILTKVSSTMWSATGTLGRDTSSQIFHCGGIKSLSATLTSVRLTTVGGTDAFTAGSVGCLIQYA